MRTRFVWSPLLTGVLLLVAVPSLRAQTRGETDATTGTGLFALVGAATDSTNTGTAAGGAITWEFTPFFGVEGAGRWMDRGAVGDAFSADLTLMAQLPVAEGRVTPYALGGVGLYRANFDLAAVPLAEEEIPEFYRERLAGSGTNRGRQSFTDPAFSFGGGVGILLGRRVVLRPDARVHLVVESGESHAVGVFVVHIGYRFEHRPVTP